MKMYFNSNVINTCMKEHKLDKKQFCVLCNISGHVFDRMMNEGVISRLSTFIKIAKSTKLKFAQLYTIKDG